MNNLEKDMEVLKTSQNSAQEDLQLIADYLAGDSDEFGKIYDKYVRKIYDFIYFKTHHKETAEDLCSKTFIKCLDNLTGYNPEKGTFCSWLYRIATNTVIDHYRTQKVHSDINDAWDLASGENLVVDLENKEKFEQVQKYISDLKPEQREIILLRAWNGLSYQEIAEIVGKSEANCKMIFSRTIAKMKAEVLIAFLILFFGK